LREGGFVRIMLKILFILAKVGESESERVLNLIKFYIFKDKPSYLKIKEFANIKSSLKKTTLKTSSKIQYNLLDLSLKQNPDIMSFHLLVSEAFAAKVLENNPTLLNSRRISKGIKIEPGKKNSIFDEQGFTWMYLIAAFIQLIHLRAFNVFHYQELELQEFSGIAKKDYTSYEKYKITLQILIDILNYAGKIEDAIKMASQITQFIEQNQKKLNSFMPSKGKITVSSCYSFLNQIYFDTKNKKFAHSRSYSIMPYDNPFSKLTKSMSAATPEDSPKGNIFLIEPFKEKFGAWIVSILSSAKITDLVQSKSKILEILLDTQSLQIIQPYLLFITSHNFKAVDTLIGNKMHAELGDFGLGNLYNNRVELQKFSRELQAKVQEKFGLISIPKEKMGIFQ